MFGRRRYAEYLLRAPEDPRVSPDRALQFRLSFILFTTALFGLSLYCLLILIRWAATNAPWARP